jgi:hypothetical protein
MIGKADSPLFTRRMGKNLFICQIYVDDIIFDSTNNSFCDEFSKIMTARFEMMSMMDEITFFLRFQINQVEDETFISQTKYRHDILKKFGMDKIKPIKTPMGTNSHLDLDMGDTSVDRKVYRFMIFYLVHLDQISCLVYVCVQDSKPRPKSAIWGLLKNNEVFGSNT